MKINKSFFGKDDFFFLRTRLNRIKICLFCLHFGMERILSKIHMENKCVTGKHQFDKWDTSWVMLLMDSRFPEVKWYYSKNFDTIQPTKVRHLRGWVIRFKFCNEIFWIKSKPMTKTPEAVSESIQVLQSKHLDRNKQEFF